MGGSQTGRRCAGARARQNACSAGHGGSSHGHGWSSGPLRLRWWSVGWCRVVCSHAVELSCRGGRGDGGSRGSVRTQQQLPLPAPRVQPKIPFRFRCVSLLTWIGQSSFSYSIHGRQTACSTVSTSPASLFHGPLPWHFASERCLPWAQICAGLCHGF